MTHPSQSHDKTTLAGRVRWAREHRMQWTQEELAVSSGVSREIIAKVEAGVTLMPRGLERIAKALEVPPGWLQYGQPMADNISDEAMEIAMAWDKIPNRSPIRRVLGQTIIATAHEIDDRLSSGRPLTDELAPDPESAPDSDD